MQISVKQLFIHTLARRQVLDLVWLRDRRLKNIYGLIDSEHAEWAGMKHGSAFEPPDILLKLDRAYPNHRAFTEPYITWLTRKRGPMTTYAFVYKLCPRENSLNWPDFWYMQNERRGMLIHLRNGTMAKGFDGFRVSALYTSAEQVQDHVKLLHQGKRNNYR